MKSDNISLTMKNLRNTGLDGRQLNLILAANCYVVDETSSEQKPSCQIAGFLDSIRFDAFILGIDASVDWQGVLITKCTEWGLSSYLFETNLANHDWSFIYGNERIGGRMAQHGIDGTIEKSIVLPKAIFDWLVEHLQNHQYVQITEKQS